MKVSTSHLTHLLPLHDTIATRIMVLFIVSDVIACLRLRVSFVVSLVSVLVHKTSAGRL